MITCQIKAVNDLENPKRGFLFDCGAVDVEMLRKLIQELKKVELVGKELIIALVQEDVFVLNTRKFVLNQNLVIVDISGSLKEPERVDLSVVAEMLNLVREQLTSQKQEEMVVLEVALNWCVPTIFGYLINYPVLYFIRPNEESNNLNFVELKVVQVYTEGKLLFSFSVPNQIYEKDLTVKESVSNWLAPFQNIEEFENKTFTATYPSVIL